MEDDDPLWIQRPPARWYVILVGVVAGFIGLLAVAYRLDGWAPALAMLLQAFSGFIFLPSVLRTSVVAYPDHLLIRNPGPRPRVRRVRRSRFDGVEVGTPAHPEIGTCVWIRLRGGDLIRVDAMWSHSSGLKGEEICAAWADRLRQWASDRSLDDN